MIPEGGWIVAKEGTEGAPPGELFVRRTSGLTRTVSPWSALIYACVGPGMTSAFWYYAQGQTLYPSAYGWVTSFAILLLLPISAIYVFMSMSMPRSGGEYIYVSRILHPLAGFIASWALTIVGMNWTGLLCQWCVNWGIGNFFLAEGMAYKNETLIHWGKYLSITTPDNRWVVWIIASCILFTITGTMAMGTKWVMRAMWFAMSTMWIMLIAFILVCVFAGGEANTIAGFEKVQGVKWSEVTTAVNSMTGGAGLPAFTVLATLFCGLIFPNLNALGSTYAANISGEIKKISKAMPLSQFGSMATFFVYWILFTLLANKGLGFNTIRMMSYLETEGAGSALIGTSPIVSYMVVWMTQNWFLIAIAGPLSAFFATWGGALALSFGPIRNFFAFSFDGLLPTWMSKVSRNGSPNRCVLVAFVISWLVLTVAVFTTWYSYITYTVTIWMVGWVILSVAAMVFPWRRRDIFEKSPQIVQSRVLGVPVISILGGFGAVVSAVSIYATLVVGNTPTMNVKNLMYTAIFFIVVPVVIYFIATTWQKRKGVPMDLRFKTVPPD
jgi:amino acid transporter